MQTIARSRPTAAASDTRIGRTLPTTAVSNVGRSTALMLPGQFCSRISWSESTRISLRAIAGVAPGARRATICNPVGSGMGIQ
jgi:hypothetical protein